MNILIYLGHPAQYHFIKHTARQLIADGHSVKLLIKTKDVLEDLLKEDGWEYENIQKTYRKNSKFAILKASFDRTLAVLKAAYKLKADILIGTDSSIAQAGWLLRKPAFTTLEDDIEVIGHLARLTYPFTTHIVVPTPCHVGKWAKKKIAYDGYMKLAYLHPNYFRPDERIARSYGIEGKYVLIRLAKLVAHHDAGIGGLESSLVKDIVSQVEEKGYRAYISSEVKLSVELEPYRLNIHYRDIHHILAFASLLISDSQSMSVEAAMLGTPSIRFSDFKGRISVLEELEEKYQLTFGIKASEPGTLKEKIDELIKITDVRTIFQERRKRMLDEKIDVTAFITWFIENYPESRNIMKNNPDYQLRFK